MDKQEVGKISHYFNKIGVAVVEVTAPIKVGDVITIGDGEEAFEQEVKSMQIEHENIEEAKPGDSVGLKVDKPVKVNWKVYK
jgi:translation elongation factor EF-1alpha